MFGSDPIVHVEDRPREAVPLLIAGLTEETFHTSTAAAVSMLDGKDSQRAAVFEAITANGPNGCTDDEIQAALKLDGSSERPRRWELWKAGRIEIRRDAAGNAIRRTTRTNRRAVVWIVTIHNERTTLS